MPRLFGTDGVRGLANSEFTPELALAVSAAAARVLADRDLGHRPVAVVGRDPRASGEMLEAAVTAGLTSAGADVLRVGVLPTPAVA
ncbi:MAG TPA: phosphoglucosamine mutase, partial [Pseudonocardiaceae bacterium]|nr:phosphoglucosamine mutase [Pseudonocardiaceae bacterium]